MKDALKTVLSCRGVYSLIWPTQGCAHTGYSHIKVTGVLVGKF